MQTLKEIYVKNAKLYADKAFLGTREKIRGENGTVTFGDYKWKTFGEVYNASHSLASYLVKNDLCPKITNEEGTFRFVALYSKNREEWIVSDLGAMLTGTTVVTLYDTLGQESIDYILM
jgi:long-chain acyl-CoA synthetase